MGTKQLNAMSPRNFKQKIEMLKRKEAASTANFMAAIRDAREICQIAGVYAPKDLGSVDQCALLKAFSVPDMNLPETRVKPHTAESPSVLPGSTNLSPSHHTGSAVIRHFSPTVRSHPPDTCSQFPTEPISVPPTHVGFGFRGSPNDPRDQRSPPLPPYTHLPDHCMNTSYPNTSMPPMNRCEDSTWACQTSCHVGISTTTNFPCTTDDASSFGSPKAVPTNTQGEQQRFLQSYSTFESDTSHTDYAGPTTCALSASNLCHSLSMDQPPTNFHHTQLQRAASSHHHPSSSTFVENVGPPPPPLSALPTSNVLQQPTVGVCQQQQQLQVPGGIIDWRRVSSDSSIRNTISASQTTPTRDLRLPHLHQPGAVGLNSGQTYPTNAHIPRSELLHPVGHSCSVINSSRKSDGSGLRRQFPVEMTVVPTANIKPLHLPSDNTIKPLSSQQYGSFVQDVDSHLLPAKRPFTTPSPSIASHHTPVTDHYYSGLHNLTLEDPTPCTTKGNDEIYLSHKLSSFKQPHTLTEHVAFHPPPAVPECHRENISSTTTFEHNVNQHGNQHPHSSVVELLDDTQQDCLDLDESLMDLPNTDSGDLDRYLQVPATLLEGSDSNAWGGRRDSCTMATEILSALSTYHSGSPNLTENQLPFDASSDGPNSPSIEQSMYPESLSAAGENSDLDDATLNAIGSDRRRSVQTPNMQDVADKLGISISSKDYQLLTDPQLADYVTDANTEAQLLL